MSVQFHVLMSIVNTYLNFLIDECYIAYENIRITSSCSMVTPHVLLFPWP